MGSTEKFEFSFISWNVCLLETSFQAPSDWRMDQAEAQIRSKVLELSPDFVCFQELPGLVPFVETHQMVPANTRSHSGDIATLAKTELFDSLESQALGKFCVLTVVPKLELSIANVHLAPGASEDFTRLRMLATIKKHCPTKHLLVVGDTNTRISEEPKINSLDLFGQRPPKPTWDSKRNRFRENGRQYTSFYTRYFHSPHLNVTHVNIFDTPIEVDGNRFYLSDHFALGGIVQLHSD